MASNPRFFKDQKKSDLVEFAQISNLPDYSKLNKADLATALDSHLSANASTYANEPRLKDYYQESGAKSPVKKAVQKVSQMVSKTDDDDAPAPDAKKARRKTTSGSASESASATASALVKTPAKEVQRRTSQLASGERSPSSPSVEEVADEINRRARVYLDKAYGTINKTGVFELTRRTREMASSPSAITFLALLFEGWCLRAGIVPDKKAGEIPVIPYITKKRTDVHIPDIFQILEPAKFWAPFTLWILTSIVLPTIVSYFINIPFKEQPGGGSSHGYGTRKATASTTSRTDLFMYNIAKGLICYLVYADHFQLFGLYSNYSIATVNESIYGGYASMLTGAGIGAAACLYEAALKK